MAIRVIFFEEYDLRWIVYSGKVSNDQVHKSTLVGYVDQSYPRLPHAFLDLRDLAEIEAGFSEIMSVHATTARSAVHSRKPYRISCHAPDDLSYGMARIYVTLLNGSGAAEAHVSRARGDALAWLKMAELPPQSEGLVVDIE